MRMAEEQIIAFVTALSSKVPTPGGGAAAAVGASIGAAAAAMAAQYTQRKKDVESGAATKATDLIAKLDLSALLAAADDDAAAYADLQRSWKDKDMDPQEKAEIEQRALSVPVKMVERCHAYALAIQEFLHVCNPNITSDAKVGIHLLSGSASAAYQTVLVNSPPDNLKQRLRTLISQMRELEDKLLDGATCVPLVTAPPKVKLHHSTSEEDPDEY